MKPANSGVSSRVSSRVEQTLLMPSCENGGPFEGGRGQVFYLVVGSFSQIFLCARGVLITSGVPRGRSSDLSILGLPFSFLLKSEDRPLPMNVNTAFHGRSLKWLILEDKWNV